jgi:hypothetical protein
VLEGTIGAVKSIAAIAQSLVPPQL